VVFHVDPDEDAVLGRRVDDRRELGAEDVLAEIQAELRWLD